MSLVVYTPAYINTTENQATKTVITPEHWNELFNLLIAQGNNSATALYNILVALAATTAADQVGAAAVTGVTGTTVQTMLASLKGLLDLCYTSSAVDTLLAQKETVANANQLVKSITFNSVDGKFTITKQDGTTSVIDTALEKVAINFTYDQDTQSLILTLADGSTVPISLASLIQENDFVDSDTIDFYVTDHTVTAVVKNASITEAMLTSATLTALVGYKNSAETSATNAAASEANALTYKNSAGTSATNANTSATSALSSKNASATSETNAKTSETNAKTSETNAATSAAQALDYKNQAAAIVGDKVISFNGRKDAVVSAIGDYNDSQIELGTASLETFPELTEGATVADAFLATLIQIGDVSEALGNHESNITVHVTDEQKGMWNNSLILKGTVAPTITTVGVAGQFYYDFVAYKMYQCKYINNGTDFIWEDIAAKDTNTILSDAVKTALALTGTKYVSDALTKLSTALFVSGYAPPATWVASTLPSSVYWSATAYGDGKFVAVAGVASATSEAAYSPDGVTWSGASLPSSTFWSSVTYGNGKFVTVSIDGAKAAYSTDGITWYAVTLPSSKQWVSVTYGNGKFVAVANNSNAVAYSSNGTNWTETTLPATSSWSSVTYGNGKFVAVGSSSTAATYSTDGITWYAATLPYNTAWQSVTYGGDKFVATSYSSEQYAYSTNGVNWTGGSLPSSANWRSVTYGAGTFIVVAGSTVPAIYSTNGINWTSCATGATKEKRAISYGAGHFVAVGNSLTNAACYTTVKALLSDVFGSRVLV